MAFSKPATPPGADPGHGPVAVLGLPHDGTTSRRGSGVSKRRTARKRLRRTKTALWRWCRAHRHAPLNDQDRRLGLKLRGPFPYEGIRGTCRVRDAVRRSAEQAWRDGLRRRRRKRAIGGETFPRLLQTDALPTPTLVHTICSVMPGRPVMRRSGAETPVTEEPSAFIAHVRDCGGAGWATTGSTRKPTGLICVFSRGLLGAGGSA
jgi:hypothetical protein